MKLLFGLFDDFGAHAVLVFVMCIAFYSGLIAINIFVGPLSDGYQGLGYLIWTFLAAASSAMLLLIWDMIHLKIGQRPGLMAIRSCISVSGSMMAFYFYYPFLNKGFDRVLFAYCSPAIAVLIGLVYAEVSFRLIARLRFKSVLQDR